MGTTDTAKSGTVKKDGGAATLEKHLDASRNLPLDNWIDTCEATAVTDNMEEVVLALEGIAAALIDLGGCGSEIHAETVNMIADYAILATKSARRIFYTKQTTY